MDDAATSRGTGCSPPAISGEAHRIPVAVRPVYEEIAGIADAFCRAHLTDEYADLSITLTANRPASGPRRCCGATGGSGRPL